MPVRHVAAETTERVESCSVGCRHLRSARHVWQRDNNRRRTGHRIADLLADAQPYHRHGRPPSGMVPDESSELTAVIGIEPRPAEGASEIGAGEEDTNCAHPRGGPRLRGATLEKFCRRRVDASWRSRRSAAFITVTGAPPERQSSPGASLTQQRRLSLVLYRRTVLPALKPCALPPGRRLPSDRQLAGKQAGAPTAFSTGTVVMNELKLTSADSHVNEPGDL